MTFFLQLLLVAYPNGFFGVTPSASSDAGMMTVKGIFAAEYNPAGLTWIDSLEIGVAGSGLFSYSMVGAAYRFRGWPLALSIHNTGNFAGFLLAGSYLQAPMSMGASLSASFELGDREDKEQHLSMRFGFQWRDYVGISIGPRLWIEPDTVYVDGLAQIGTSIPVVEDLDILLGAAAYIAPSRFRAGGGVAYSPFGGALRIESVLSTDGWGFGVKFDNIDDRVGAWVRKGFGADTLWRFGLSYVRNLRSSRIREVTVFRNLAPRIDTVYVSVDTSKTNSHVVTNSSPAVRKKQEQLMAKANKLYAKERYEEALVVWEEVVKLDSLSDLAARAREDIAQVQALIETLERIRSGKDKSQ